MKLVHVDISRQINFDESMNYALAIENSQEFYRLTAQFVGQCNGEQGDFALYDGQLIDIAKSCLVFYDYYSDVLSSKKATNAVQTQIVDILKNNDFIEDFSNLNVLIANINEKILEKTDLPISCLDEIDYENFTKMLGYKASKSQSLVDDILSFVQLNMTGKTKVVAFIGLCDVLSQQQTQSLLKMLNYMQLKVLLIESHIKYKLEQCETVIVDEDLCVI